MLAALNGLDVMCVDLQNAYFTVPYREKVYISAGEEW